MEENEQSFAARWKKRAKGSDRVFTVLEEVNVREMEVDGKREVLPRWVLAGYLSGFIISNVLGGLVV